jgi:tetratricopeptide (TPR) repeat protein/pimeloyl-ACP methyl ester carboxylesterase
MSRLIKIADWGGEKRGNVVFVHGLGGHPYDTWRRRADDGTFWPLWLAEDIKGLAVYSLGYISPPTNWIGTAMPLLDEAAHALRVLLNSEDLKTGPIAFICHSLGGLIVKQVLRAANEQRNNPDLADFLARTRQVVFIATPHTGSGKATLMERLRFIAWGSDSARDLVANKPELRDLNFGYRELAKARGDALCHLAYYEMVDTPFGRIVNPDSADPGLPDCRPTPIRKDHVAIAKPRRRDDLVYAETRGFISKLAVEPAAVAEVRSYPLESFKIEWSWQRALPKLVRVAAVSLLAIGLWQGLPLLNSTIDTIFKIDVQVVEVRDLSKETLNKIGDQQRELAEIKERLIAAFPMQLAPGADKAIGAAVDAAAQGASAGDARLQRALEFLKAGNAKEAEPMFRAVAEEKAARIKTDSKDAATAFRNLGAIAGLADPKRALDAYQKAAELDPDDMNSIFWVGWMQLERGNLQEAEARFRRVLLATKTNNWADYWARISLGDIRIARGNLADALKSYRDGLSIAERLAQADPGNAGWQRDLSVSFERVGDVLVAQGNLAEALKSFRGGLAIRERLAQADPGNAGWQRNLSVSFDRVGDVLVAQGNLPVSSSQQQLMPNLQGELRCLVFPYLTVCVLRLCTNMQLVSPARQCETSTGGGSAGAHIHEAAAACRRRDARPSNCQWGHWEVARGLVGFPVGEGYQSQHRLFPETPRGPLGQRGRYMGPVFRRATVEQTSPRRRSGPSGV